MSTLISYRNELGAWQPRQLFYPGVGPDQGAGFINAEGDHPPGWQDPDAVEAKAKKACDELYPTAAKSKGAIGESKKWKACKASATDKADKVREANAKLASEFASEQSFSQSVRSLTEPTVTAAAGTDYTTAIVGLGVLLLVGGAGWFIYNQFFKSSAAPAAAPAA